MGQFSKPCGCCGGAGCVACCPGQPVACCPEGIVTLPLLLCVSLSSDYVDVNGRVIYAAWSNALGGWSGSVTLASGWFVSVFFTCLRSGGFVGEAFSGPAPGQTRTGFTADPTAGFTCRPLNITVSRTDPVMQFDNTGSFHSLTFHVTNCSNLNPDPATGGLPDGLPSTLTMVPLGMDLGNNNPLYPFLGDSGGGVGSGCLAPLRTCFTTVDQYKTFRNKVTFSWSQGGWVPAGGTVGPFGCGAGLLSVKLFPCRGDTQFAITLTPANPDWLPFTAFPEIAPDTYARTGIDQWITFLCDPFQSQFTGTEFLKILLFYAGDGVDKTNIREMLHSVFITDPPGTVNVGATNPVSTLLGLTAGPCPGGCAALSTYTADAPLPMVWDGCNHEWFGGWVPYTNCGEPTFSSGLKAAYRLRVVNNSLVLQLESTNGFTTADGRDGSAPFAVSVLAPGTWEAGPPWNFNTFAVLWKVGWALFCSSIFVPIPDTVTYFVTIA